MEARLVSLLSSVDRRSWRFEADDFIGRAISRCFFGVEFEDILMYRYIVRVRSLKLTIEYPYPPCCLQASIGLFLLLFLVLLLAAAVVLYINLDL